MSLNYILLLTCYIACRPLALCGNVANQNSSQVIDSMKCGLLNISCDFGKICRSGACINIEVKTNSTDGGKGDSKSTEMTYRMATDPIFKVTTTRTRPPRRTHSTTKSHSFITGNQEFTIALVGFSVLFINFCLITFCLGRMKRRRLEQQRQQRRRQEATRSSQASQTGDWNAEYLNTGIDNFALNGDLDAFSNDFMFPQVRLPPYDFSSAYHKPTPMTEEETGEGELSGDVNVDVQDINEDPPPYSDQQFDHLGSPPSYNETLTVSTAAGESSS